MLASVPGPHTGVDGTSRYSEAPSPYSRAPNFFNVPRPQIYTLTTAMEASMQIGAGRDTRVLQVRVDRCGRTRNDDGRLSHHMEKKGSRSSVSEKYL